MESKIQIHKINASQEQASEMLNYYQGYLTYNASTYIIARAKLANCTITFYRTNVVLFQGIDEAKEYNLWANKYHLQLDEEATEESENIYQSISAIGSDEVGTGDYFGPIVVCASYVSEKNIETLRQLGVKDSKLLTDKQMIPMALNIARLIPYSIVLLEPTKINQLKARYANLNFIKSYLHNKAITSILKKIGDVKCDAILIDEFTPREKYFEYLQGQKEICENVTTIPHGERANIAIAASSVLARATFLRELNKMATSYGFDFVKGASHDVDRSAVSFVRSYGWDALKDVAKIKFANTNRIEDYLKENPLPKSRQGHFYEDIEKNNNND
jgi:ribonuclease HIII